MKLIGRLLILSIGLLQIIGFQSNAQVSFTEGFDFQQLNYGYGNGTFGGGVSFTDINNDGFDDLTFTTELGSNLQFFLSNGMDLLPTDLGIELSCESKQVVWADYDHDGDLDLFVMCIEGTVQLFKQINELEFEHSTDLFNIPVVGFMGYTFTLFDFNRNGFLDLAVTSYNSKGTYLFLNDTHGDFQIKGGTGLEFIKKPTLQIINIDFNSDGWEDLYLANDRNAGNNLMLNNGDSTFTDVSNVTGTDVAMDAMGLISLNTDNNEFPDLYISNSDDGNVLLQNIDGTKTLDIAHGSGSEFGGSAWGASLADFNLDGKQDLYISGSQVGAEVISSSLLLRQTSASFIQAEREGMRQDTTASYGNATGDFNHDGWPDIAVNNSQNSHHHLWINKSSQNNNWLKIELIGKLSNIHGFGARIEYFVNGKREILWKHSASSYLSQSSLTQTIGLGTNQMIDSLLVKWPSGLMDRFYQLSANQTYSAIEGSSEVAQSISLSSDSNLFCHGEQINATLPYFGNDLNVVWSDGNTDKTRQFTSDFMGNAKIYKGSTLIAETEVIEINFDLIPEPNLIIQMEESGASVTLSFDVNISNYSFDWSHNSTLNFNTAHGLQGGEYEVIITNSNGCQKTIVFEVPMVTSLPKEETSGIKLISNYGVWNIQTRVPLESLQVFLLNDQGTIEELTLNQEKSTLKVDFKPNRVYQLIIKSSNKYLFKYRFIIPN